MERERSGKVIAIATLIIAIAGLSLGFAAFSTSLNISSSADVPVDASVWKVGFSNSTSSIPDVAVTVNGQTNSANNGTLSLSQFVISQDTNATLNTTNGSKVEYSFYIVNHGDIDAYLNSVTMGNLSCEYQSSMTPRTTDNGHTTISGGTGTISDTDCRKLFKATLAINDDVNATFINGAASKSSGFGTTAKLADPSGNPRVPTYVPVKLTIEYQNDSLHTVDDAPNGDFTVSLSDTVVVYGSTSN